MLAQLILNKVSFDTILEFLKIKKELTVQVLFGVEQVSKMEPEIYKNNCNYRTESTVLSYLGGGNVVFVCLYEKSVRL